MLNFLWRDSYIRPHRHAADPKPETLVALRGEIGCLTFDDRGEIVQQRRIVASGDCPVIVVEPREWHSVVALSETALLLEFKAGPFDPSAAKEPAAWAAEEGAATAVAYLRSLQERFD